MAAPGVEPILSEIRACTVCAPHLPDGPRPIVQAGRSARILIIGQAPGSRVHASGTPWDDDSGDRLRGWIGLDPAAFYDADKVALMPMGFCYPGKGASGDMPPRPECAPLWHDRLRAAVPDVRLTLLVGQYALARYWPARPARSMTDAVRGYVNAPDGLFPTPHPSWRVTLWMRKNPWYEAEVLPVLRQRVAAALA